MPQYKVLRDFAADYGERAYSGQKGQIVDLADEVAAWLNRDSPGRLRPYKGRKRAVTRAPRNRQVTEAQTRGRRQYTGDPGDGGAITRETFGAVKDREGD